IRGFQNSSYLPAEIAFYFEHQAAQLQGRIFSTPAEQLVDVWIHARRCFPGSDCPKNHHTRVQTTLRDREPMRLGPRPGCTWQMTFTKNEHRRRSGLRFWVRRQRPGPTRVRRSIRHDCEQRSSERRSEKCRRKPQGDVPIREHVEDERLLEGDQRQKRVL